MSSLRQNGMYHLLRMWRVVVGAVVPEMRYCTGGLATVIRVSASKP